MSALGAAEVLILEQRAVPTPNQNELLIRVATAGINRGDIVQRRGSYPPPPGASDILGLEVAGEVVATGKAARRFKVGDKVMSLVAGGGYAQYCTAHETHTFPIPPGIGMVAAASIPETFMTVWHNVFQRGALQTGETILIHGGSSGIGITAIQIAKAFGAKVIVTAGSKEKCDACIGLGADRAINYKTEDFVSEVRAVTDGVGAHTILALVKFRTIVQIPPWHLPMPLLPPTTSTFLPLNSSSWLMRNPCPGVLPDGEIGKDRHAF